MLPSDSNLWLPYTSIIDYPMILAAIDLKIFDFIANKKKVSTDEVSAGCNLGPRGTSAFLNHLTAMGLLLKKRGKFSLSVDSAAYLNPAKSSYWGYALMVPKRAVPLYDRLIQAVNAERQKINDPNTHTSGWKQGSVDPAKAAQFTKVMHAFSLYAAQEVAKVEAFRNTKKLLDVGAGSGSFAIAIAKKHKKITCALGDFMEVCDVAMEFVVQAGLQDRIVKQPMNMFEDIWPRGFDGIFMANILHDWSDDDGMMLLRKAFDTLEGGGHIFICEMLLDGSETSPRVATGLAAAMFVNTEGRQFTKSQLTAKLKMAGFKKVSTVRCGDLYSVVHGIK